MSQRKNLKLCWLPSVVLLNKFELLIPWLLENREEGPLFQGQSFLLGVFGKLEQVNVSVVVCWMLFVARALYSAFGDTIEALSSSCCSLLVQYFPRSKIPSKSSAPNFFAHAVYSALEDTIEALSP